MSNGQRNTRTRVYGPRMVFYAAWLVGALLGALIVPVLHGGWLIAAGALLGLLLAHVTFERYQRREARRFPV